jgi:hypothetical protein
MATLSIAAGGGAKIATGMKAPTPAAAAVIVAKAKRDGDATKKAEIDTKSPTTNPLAWSDLFRDDNGDWDIGDAQMIIATAVSIIAFLITMITLWNNLPLAAHIDLPDPTNALTLALGGSLGGYLAKKIGGEVGSD